MSEPGTKIIRVQIKMIDLRQVDVKVSDTMNPLAIQSEIADTAQKTFGGYDDIEIIGIEDLPEYLRRD